MNTNPISDQIEQLLKDKDVSALTKDEQQRVIRELGSLDAYARLRTIASRSQEVFSREAIVPSGAVLGNILARAEKAHRPQREKKVFYQLPIPLYQAAATVLLAIGLTWWWTSSRLTFSQDPVVITLVDTVYQEVVRVDTIRMEAPTVPALYTKSNKPRKEVSTKPTLLASNENRSPDYRFSRGDYPITSAHRSGQSLREQPLIFALDSMPGMEHVFAADKVF
ncbi:MAG: hypothetical protein K9I85_13290 [Saprospiraceae bacterium]|nr:hypothetical protein [Saprospiraceae bacterium]